MDISADRSKSSVWQTLRGFFSRLIGFFILTEEEQSKAGIYLGGEGHDG